MREIILDGSAWQNRGDFYDAFFEAVGAPDWHGRNLDALNDSIGTGDINKIEAPYALKIVGFDSMAFEAQQMVERFKELIEHLKSEGVEVNLICE